MHQKRAKKFYTIILLVILIIFRINTVFAEKLSLVDLNSELYTNLYRWESKGYMDTLPRIQPYAHYAVISRLERMLSNEELPNNERSVAQRYYNTLKNPEVTGRLGSTPHFRVSEKGINLNLNVNGGFSWLIEDRNDLGSTWLEAQMWIQFVPSALSEISLPAGTREPRDWARDTFIPTLSVLGVGIQSLSFPYSLISFSSVNNNNGFGVFTFKVGMHRSSIGSIVNDGIIYSSQTPAAGHFGLSYEHYFDDSEDGINARLFYNSQLSLLSASNDRGEGNFGQKYLVYHTLGVEFTHWFSLAYFESTIFGGTMDFLNLIPLSGFIFNQALAGLSGNTLIGLEAVFRPVPEIKIPVIVYFDDLAVDADSDPPRFAPKFAGQLEIQWSPLLPFLDQLSADYTIVMPYMYTHWGERAPGDQPEGAFNPNTPNYTNYTHARENIGPGLEPNSDRWRITWSFRPLAEFTDSEDWFRDFTAIFGIQLIRHANASEGIPGISSTIGRGTIFDSGYTDDGQPTFTPEQDDYIEEYMLAQNFQFSRFLTQSVIEHNLQFSLGIKTSFQITQDFQIQTELKYTHEQIWNFDTVRDAHRAFNYFSILIGISD